MMKWLITLSIPLLRIHLKTLGYHFHCKEGIGRTTTFMIMYDIMKNYKEVSLNDIIKRQYLPSGIKEKDAKIFIVGITLTF